MQAQTSQKMNRLPSLNIDHLPSIKSELTKTFLGENSLSLSIEENDIGEIIEASDGFFEWRKENFPPLRFSHYELLQFLSHIRHVPFFSLMIQGKKAMGFTSDSDVLLLENMIKEGIMEKWIDLPGMKGYRLKEYQ